MPLMKIKLCPPRTQKHKQKANTKEAMTLKGKIFGVLRTAAVGKKNVPKSLGNQHLMIVGLLTPYPSKPQQSPNGFARTLAKLRHYIHNSNTILL